MIYYQRGGTDETIDNKELCAGLNEALGKIGPRRKVCVIPPDFTRFHSHGGIITKYLWEYYGTALVDIMPALGTHRPMNKGEIKTMFPGLPLELFREHRWRSDTVTLGKVPHAFISELIGTDFEYDWPAQVNRLLCKGGHDLIVSPGQVVPHEVTGMANHAKNIFIGEGGNEGIHRSHFLSAVYGIERIMGRIDNPVRAIIDYAAREFAAELPILYALTVLESDELGKSVVRGFFIGDDRECFEKASKLSAEVNITMVEKPIKKCVTYLNPEKFHSTWLGNKAIYRTRMAIADGGELIILAPGVKVFSEDKEIDSLIRRFGYFGTEKTLQELRHVKNLRINLGVAAHLIHGSSEDRFKITYAPGFLSREECESVGFGYTELEAMLEKYNPSKLRTGWNRLDDEEFYYVDDPALGLWAHPSRMEM
ncbi:Novel D-mannonate dehydrogenase [Olavius algarvensis spirochete endosymbiont]|uniref:lactate racemase domain-containing protein n=1 Tax=Olavius algarvensis spirochete endosymbiont TaxID=260710 RepID=UPI000F1A3234|nr:lactate racemase domain-containing protein [Olavius algarvensis spirochete endosymbiont]VDB00190.1 Novel D-mannonate dehydrogenase [Olavius algarvensis spirochete endosymbiont]